MSDPAATVAAIAAEDAAEAATVAAAAAAAASEPPQLDPNAMIAADTEIAREQEETERARIAARAQVKIAELQQEEPPWLSDIRECLTRLETAVTALATSRQSSIPPPSSEVTIVEQPEAPVIVDQSAGEGEVESGDQTPVSLADQPPAAPAAPAREAPRKPRWI